MFDQFIAVGAPEELNLDDVTRKSAEAEMTLDALQIPLFLQVRVHVQQLVFEQTYPRYLQQQLRGKRRWHGCSWSSRRNISTSASSDAIVLAEIAVHQHE
jgi:hypothetical protein